MKRRLQFDFTDSAVERLDKIVRRTDAASRAEVVRRALSLYEMALDMDEVEDALIVRSKKTGKEYQLMVL